jgi:hypothetical protein
MRLHKAIQQFLDSQVGIFLSGHANVVCPAAQGVEVTLQ